jgi:two-component system, sensor histidine kinase
LADGPRGKGCSELDLTMDELTAITEHLLRFSPDALIVVDDQGRIRFCNETVREVLGYEPGLLLGQPLEMLVPQRFRGRHGQHTAGYMRCPANREMGARIKDLFALRADGTEFSAGIRLSPFRIGGNLFVVAAVRDMTEHREINDELVAAREEADRANRAKTRFLATASHDLRQPMQTVRLLNAAMLRLVPETDIRELLQQQSQAIESMAQLLNALLDISRLESGAIEPLVVDVPLEDVFAELRSEFESVARTRGVFLRIDASPLVASTDRILFYQLLQNLLGNALKYTDRGSVHLSCTLDEEALTIAVEDTGIGIPADKLERIFDEYYQIDTHGTKRMGVGLGLAIVREAARLLGFAVRISSIVGQGTQVYVGVPRHLIVAPASVCDVAMPQEPPDASRKSRLILVEDNDGVRLATETFLKIEGHETVSARSISDAERVFATTRQDDIIIADYHLDGKNTGFDLLLRLRERLGYEVPGIILSGDLPTVLRSIKAPVPNCRFLSKPVDTDALLEAIGQLTPRLPRGA